MRSLDCDGDDFDPNRGRLHEVESSSELSCMPRHGPYDFIVGLLHANACLWLRSRDLECQRPNRLGGEIQVGKAGFLDQFFDRG